MQAQFRVAVVGGGITGLAAAQRLIELARGNETALDVTVFESEKKIGGVIQTVRDRGFVMELGPDSIFTAKKCALGLFSRLRLSDSVLPTSQENRKSLVAYNGKLHALPEGFVMVAPSKLVPFAASSLMSPLGKVRMALDMVLPAKTDLEDETVEAFIRRRLGREALERVAQPMVGGIYVGDVAQLSAQSTLERFVSMERTHGSIIKGLMAEKSKKESAAAPDDGTVSGARYSLFVTLKNGLGTLIDRLEEELSGSAAKNCQAQLSAGGDGCTITGDRAPTKCRILKNCRIIRLERTAEGLWCLLNDSGERQVFNAVIFANPAPIAGRIVAPVDAEIAAALASIKFASSCVINFLFRRSALPRPLSGFGFVVPQSQRRSILAASFSSMKYSGRAPQDHVVIRAFIGGVLDEHLLHQEDSKLIELARQDLAYYLGIKEREEFSHLSRWVESMPQYTVGHHLRVERLQKQAQERLPGIYFAGNSYAGVGIPDCIMSGERSAGMCMQYAYAQTSARKMETVSL